MIRNFRSKPAEDIFNGTNSRYARKISSQFYGKIQRLFDQINAASYVDTLRVPPSNHLEKLTGNLQGFWSIRINKQWRIIFKWEDNDALDVDIVDYH